MMNCSTNTTKRMLQLSRSLCRASGVAMIALSPLLATIAEARPRLAVDMSVLAGGSTNPFLLNGSGTGSAQVTGSVSPRVTFESAKGNVTIGSTYRRTQYTSRYGGTDGISGYVSTQWRPKERWNIDGSLGYDNSIAGESQSFARDANNIPLIDDLSLSGLRVRRQFYRANVQTSYQPTSRDTFSVGAFAILADVGRVSQFSNDNFLANDYFSYGSSIGYNRAISSRTSVGLSLGGSFYECRNGPSCRNSTFQPSVTFSHALDSRWTVSGSGGVAFTTANQNGLTSKRTSAAGGLNLCRKDSRIDFCLNGSRTTQATSSFGAQPSTAIGASLKSQLTSRTSLTGSLNYVNSSQAFLSTTPGVATIANFEFWSARLVGNRQITENASLTLSGGYDRSVVARGADRSNFEVLMGVSVSLGRQ
jgi:hypothetical protein